MLHRAFVPGLTAFAGVVLAVCCVMPTTSSASVISSDSALYGVPRAEGPARMELMAQPMTRRVKTSSTATTYNQPWPVRMPVAPRKRNRKHVGCMTSL